MRIRQAPFTYSLQKFNFNLKAILYSVAQWISHELFFNNFPERHYMNLILTEISIHKHKMQSLNSEIQFLYLSSLWTAIEVLFWKFQIFMKTS